MYYTVILACGHACVGIEVYKCITRLLSFHTLAVKSVSNVSRKTRTCKTAQRVGAVSEYIARAVLAFVLV